jgi:hypothetical protein
MTPNRFNPQREYPNSYGALAQKEKSVMKPDLETSDIVHGQSTVRAYHWREGIYFSRMESGDVRIHKAPALIDMLIPANEWASIVSSVSKGGETSESYSGTLAFHTGSIPYPSPGRLVPNHGSGPDNQ